MKDPRITVLMPAYNAGQYIAEAIASVLAQTFTDFELLIVNDGSTDNTVEVISSFDDPRIVVLHQVNLGVAAALNNGLKHARAGLIARFDADDICYPNRLAVQYEFMQHNPQYAIIGSAADYCDEDGGFVFTYQPRALLGLAEDLSICPFVHSTVLYKKQVVLSLGGYDKNAYAFEDHLLWGKLLKEHSGFNIVQPLIKVRLNPASVTVDDQWQDPLFKKIKRTAIERGHITQKEAAKLRMIRKQQTQKQHREAYYGLLAKKFLWDNYRPAQARQYLFKLISLNPLAYKSNMLLLLSLLPERAIKKIYVLITGKKGTPDDTVHQPEITMNHA